MNTRQIILSALLALGMLTAMPQFAFGQLNIDRTGFFDSNGNRVQNNSNELNIDKTGFFDSNGNRVQINSNELNIDKTGIVGSATFGYRYNFNDGTWLQGLTDSYGRPECGQMHYTNGDVYYGQFKNGLREDQSGLYEATDGSWYYGGWSNGYRHGEGSYYNASTGLYYNQTWSYGNLISSVQVNSPKYDRDFYHEMMVDADILKTTGDGSSSSSSSSSRSSTSSRRACTACNGTGVRAMDTTVGTYGLSNGKKYCATCNKWIPAGIAHSHTTCKVCGGTGIMQ